ncbi:MAG: DUF305 domain-containing protein [Gammaproteobacteria bacterium]|jgi:uncharacterized protein (DUF305 family)|nr:DUF305 domain-containing protein [Candidatus Saccharibacteria bacterium]MBP9727686.1 DUF305 domain-containing protein [Gammaproteobacteria bacterium]
MKKNKNNILILAIVAIVAIAGMVLFAVTSNNDGKMNGGMMSNNNSSQDSSNGLVDKNSADYKMYSELTGDDYDRMFIANMIEHHKGAVDMAKLAQANAKHQELKDMADAIIAAQSKEITDMETWQKEWGYPSSSGEMMMDHSAMGMMADMGQMTEELKSLTGDAFDKAFISSMIEHHQSAINMAYPGQTNAKHDEIKQLTKAIVEAQSNEITQMKQWQKDWGY